MDKVNFSDGLHPLTADLNALGTFTEAGVDALLRAISTSETGQLLFDAFAPSVELSGANLAISVPAQRFAVGGAVQVAPDAANTFDNSTDLWVAIYLIAGKSPETQARDFTSIDPTTGLVVQQQLSTDIYYKDDPSVNFEVSTNILAEPAPPVIDSLAAGYVKLADVKYTQATGDILVALNTTAQYTLPAGALGGIGAHGSTHAEGGSDPLPVATTSGSSSTGGLMPVGSQYKVDQSIQGIVPATGSEYLEITTDAGRNTTVGVRLADSMDLVDDGGVIKLGPNMRPKNVVNGNEDRVARADHRHTALSSGLLVQKTFVDITPSILGSVFTVDFAAQTLGTEIVAAGQIINVALYWAPPNPVDPSAPRSVECGWSLIWESGANRSVGARSMIIGPASFRVEIGELAPTVLTNSALSEVQGGAWTSPAYSGGQFPQSGQLVIIATAVSSGSQVNTP